jgi:hypothetical protein
MQSEDTVTPGLTKSQPRKAMRMPILLSVITQLAPALYAQVTFYSGLPPVGSSAG